MTRDRRSSLDRDQNGRAAAGCARSARLSPASFLAAKLVRSLLGAFSRALFMAPVEDYRVASVTVVCRPWNTSPPSNGRTGHWDIDSVAYAGLRTFNYARYVWLPHRAEPFLIRRGIYLRELSIFYAPLDLGRRRKCKKAKYDKGGLPDKISVSHFSSHEK